MYKAARQLEPGRAKRPRHKDRNRPRLEQAMQQQFGATVVLPELRQSPRLEGMTPGGRKKKKRENKTAGKVNRYRVLQMLVI